MISLLLWSWLEYFPPCQALIVFGQSGSSSLYKWLFLSVGISVTVREVLGVAIGIKSLVQPEDDLAPYV